MRAAAKQAKPLLLKAPAYARLMGVDPRSITRLIVERGLPAKKVKGVWHVRPAEADAWIEQYAPRIADRLLVAPKVRRPPRRGQAQPATLNGHDVAIDRHIRRLDVILEAFVETMYQGGYDRAAVTAIKQLSTELRQLERHRFDMREAERRTVGRDRYETAIGSIGQLVADEVGAFATVVPDRMLSALTRGGIKVSNSGKALQLLGQAAEKATNGLRDRIADAIEAIDL